MLATSNVGEILDGLLLTSMKTIGDLLGYSKGQSGRISFLRNLDLWTMKMLMREAKHCEQRPSFSPHLLPQTRISQPGALLQWVPVKKTPLVCPPSVCPSTAQCRAALQDVIKMIVMKSLSTVSRTRMRAAVLLMKDAAGVSDAVSGLMRGWICLKI